MQAQLRLYEELNDYLPPRMRKKPLDFTFSDRTTIRKLLKTLKIPASSVDLALADGVSVSLSHSIRENQRISLFPVFELLDVGALQRVRSRTLRRTRFALYAGLAPLGAYLRLLGFDVVQFEAESEEALAECEEDNRILLTLDRGQARRDMISRALCLGRPGPYNQLLEVLDRLDLWQSLSPWTRCIHCNQPVRRRSEAANSWRGASCRRCGRAVPDSGCADSLGGRPVDVVRKVQQQIPAQRMHMPDSDRLVG